MKNKIINENIYVPVLSHWHNKRKKKIVFHHKVSVALKGHTTVFMCQVDILVRGRYSACEKNCRKSTEPLQELWQVWENNPNDVIIGVINDNNDVNNV